MSDVLTEQQVAARGRELEQSKWHLPDRYRLDADLLALPPEELQKKNPEMFALWQRTQEEQKRMAEQFASPHARPSSQEIFRARSVQRAEELRNTIARIDQQIGQVLTGAIEGDLSELQSAKLALRHRRAENLAVHGRYDLAFEVEPEAAYRDHYLAILDAIYRDDDEHCGCGDIRGSGEHANLTVPSFNAKEDVWSLKHGRMITLMKCSMPGCGFMNAIDTPAHVKTLRSHRARAHQLAGKLSPEDAFKLLSEKGHTTANLLK